MLCSLYREEGYQGWGLTWQCHFLHVVKVTLSCHHHGQSCCGKPGIGWLQVWNLLFLADFVEDRKQTHQSTDRDLERSEIHQTSILQMGRLRKAVEMGPSGCPSVMPVKACVL